MAIFSIAECEKSKDPLFSGAHCLCLWGTGDKVVSKEGHEHVLSLCSGVDSGESRLITYEGGFHNLLLGNRSPIHEAFLTITRLSTGEHSSALLLLQNAKNFNSLAWSHRKF